MNVTKLGGCDAPEHGVRDGGLRVVVVTPVVVVLASIVGAGTVGGVILFVVAGIMLAAAATGFLPDLHARWAHCLPERDASHRLSRPARLSAS